MKLSRRTIQLVAGGLLLLSPAIAMADDAIPVDARLQGYKESQAPADPESTTITWFVLIGLGIVGTGTLFMSANRTHLD